MPPLPLFFSALFMAEDKKSNKLIEKEGVLQVRIDSSYREKFETKF